MRHHLAGGRRAAAALTFAAVVAAGVAVPATASVASPRVATLAVAATTTAKPHVTTAPKSVVVASGKTATFTVKASGTALTYRWYTSKDGTKWSAVSKATKSSYTVKATAALNGHRYRVVVKNAHGSVTSAAAKLTVAVTPKVTAQPKAVTVVSGKKATFTVKATGNALAYQWYAEAPGKKFAAIKGATKSSYALTTSAAKNGYSYRVVASNKAGKVTSSTARLTVISTPKITKQPTEFVDVASGTKVTLSVAASGAALHYQWQYADDSLDGDGSFHNISGATGATYTFTATTKSHDDLRVVVSNAAGKVASQETVVAVESSSADPYGPDGIALLTSWIIGLDTDVKGGPTRIAGTNPVTVTTTFLAIPAAVHASPDDLVFDLVVGATSYHATVTQASTSIPGVDDLVVTAPNVPLSVADAAKGVWRVTEGSGSAAVTQYFAQR